MNLRHAVSTYRGHTIPHFQFIERRNIWFAFSGILIVLSLVGPVVRGLNYSIDFEGGALIEYTVVTPVTGDQSPVGAWPTTGRSRRRGAARERRPAGADPHVVADGGRDLAGADRGAREAGGDHDAATSTSRTSAPRGGARSPRRRSAVCSSCSPAIALYIALRFEWKMAVGAMIALVHDVVITAGVYALVGREVTPETVIAILTILGFSLYDTVVIYDKIKENTESSALVVAPRATTAWSTSP